MILPGSHTHLVAWLLGRGKLQIAELQRSDRGDPQQAHQRCARGGGPAKAEGRAGDGLVAGR